MNKFSLTIGIPAHNEEANIASILQKLLNQSKENYKLEKIIVMCDGCTDYTEPLVRRVSEANPEVMVVNDKLRKGKASRLNEIFRLNTSDILLTIDADLIIESDNLLDELVKPFKNTKVGLVTGFSYPMQAENTAQKIIISWFYLWYEVRKRINKGNNIHNIQGAMSAMRRELVENITFPANTIATAQYLYFATQKAGYQFYYTNKARVRFYVPSTLQDYFLQTNRYGREQEKQQAVFGDEIVKAHSIPTMAKVMGVIISFIKRPLFTPFAIMLYFSLRRKRTSTDALQGEGLWTPIASTKRSLKFS